jgi:hypothetical protein
MKKIILGLCVLFSSLGFAQIGEVKEVKTEFIGMTAKANLNVQKQDNSNKYAITFLNTVSEHPDDFRSLEFYGEQKDLEYLYAFLNSQFNSNTIKSIEVGASVVRVENTGNKIKVDIFTSDIFDGSFTLTTKQLNKLFGKA